MTRLAVWIATAGGLGYAPVAPGTFGSAGGLVIYWFTRHWDPRVQLMLALAVIGSIGLGRKHRLNLALVVLALGLAGSNWRATNALAQMKTPPSPGVFSSGLRTSALQVKLKSWDTAWWG